MLCVDGRLLSQRPPQPLVCCRGMIPYVSIFTLFACSDPNGVSRLIDYVAPALATEPIPIRAITVPERADGDFDDTAVCAQWDRCDGRVFVELL